ncbi:MAG TPA: DUF1273 domain-containing protein [Candidatus Dormibacteraeota bacterium]
MKLRDEHSTQVGVSGMALGADTWWAEAVNEAGLKLWAHIPFPQQADRWRQDDVHAWNNYLRRAWKLTTYGGYYDVRFLHARNAGMVDVADAAIAVWCPSKTTGGTAGAVRLLATKGIPVVHVNPEAWTTTLRRSDASMPGTAPASTLAAEQPALVGLDGLGHSRGS